MSSRPRAALQDLMTAVDAGHHVVVADGDTDKLLPPRQRSSYGARARNRKSAPAPAPAPVAVETSSDASFEFSAVASYGAASPASMVFSDGQLRAHQFPAVRSSAGSSQAASPARSASAGAGGSRSATRASMGSKKRVSFATDGAGKAAKAGGGQGKKRGGGGGGGGLLGCMASACRSSRNEVVDPARHNNRKMVAA